MSVSIIAPTMAMAFTTTLTVQSSGRAAPLVFLLGAVAMAIVGLSFAALGQRVAHAGSADVYVTHVFGPRWGFVAGWVLLLSYLMFTAGVTAIVGNFVAAALLQAGIHIQQEWLAICLVCALIAIWFVWYDMRIAARLMLALEGISVLTILFLAARILTKVPLSTIPFRPDPSHGWSGIGYGLVFAVLAFAGFEGAAAIGAETRNARRIIPLAIIVTVVIAGLFYLIVSYAEVMGYGLDRVQMLAQADAPLDTLSAKFVSAKFAIFIDVAAALSAFAAAIGSLSAASRMMYAVGRSGLVPKLGELHPKHGTPGVAALVVGGLNIAGLLLWGARYGVESYSGSVLAIGTLSLVLIYLAITMAAMVEAVRNRRVARSLLGLLGGVLLLWPLWNSVYPVPRWPSNLWPYFVVSWLVAGALLAFLRPAAELVPAAAD
jgi:amino acid transporter